MPDEFTSPEQMKWGNGVLNRPWSGGEWNFAEEIAKQLAK